MHANSCTPAVVGNRSETEQVAKEEEKEDEEEEKEEEK